MQAEQQHGIGWYIPDVLSRPSCYPMESDCAFSSSSANTNSSSSSSSSSSSKFSSSSASPVKCSTFAASHTTSGCIHVGHSSSSSEGSTGGAGLRKSVWKRARSLCALLTSTDPYTPAPGCNTAAAAPEQTSGAGDEVQLAQELYAGLNDTSAISGTTPRARFIAPDTPPVVHQKPQQAVYASCQQQQQQLGPVLQAIVAASPQYWQGAVIQATAQSLCQQQQQQGISASQPHPETGAAHLCQLQYQQQFGTAELTHIAALQQQQQQQQQACQHAYCAHLQLAGVPPPQQQQQQQQQLQFMPVMVPHESYPAAVPVHMPGTVPIIQPALISGSYVSNVVGTYAIAQTRSESSSSSSKSKVVAAFGTEQMHAETITTTTTTTSSSSNGGSSSFWGMTWAAAAGMIVQQASFQQQGSSSSSSMEAAKEPAREYSISAHWFPSSLLSVLICLVVAVLSMHKRLQGVMVSALGRNITCSVSNRMQQQLQLFAKAAAEAANAAGVEQLRALLGSPKRSRGSSSSSSSNNVAQLPSEAALNIAAVPGGVVLDSIPPEPQKAGQPASSSRRTNAFSGLDEFTIASGLCAGTVMWAGKWLFVHVPAATGHAVTCKLQQGTKAAEEACVLALDYALHVCYELVWFVSKQLHALAVRAVQSVYVHGTAAAQHACCAVLWMIAMANITTSSSSDDNQQQQQQSAGQLLLVHMLQGSGRAAAKCGQMGVTAVESVVTAVAVKLLRDASPVTQTAVWGLAGMLKRNAVETCSLCWQLLLQLSQVYMIQQQQQQRLQQELKQQ